MIHWYFIVFTGLLFIPVAILFATMAVLVVTGCMIEIYRSVRYHDHTTKLIDYWSVDGTVGKLVTALARLLVTFVILALVSAIIANILWNYFPS